MTEQIRHIASVDGARIGYRQSGRGPGLIICHGGGRISQNYQKLAAALADDFTVYIPDRRGRGLSGPANEHYSIAEATADLAAVINATGADYIFGHSAGGLIALETMLTRPVSKLAVYEPPISVDGAFPIGWLAEFEGALKQGRLKKAMAISLKGLRPVPEMAKMPVRLLTMLVKVISLAERKKEKGTRMLDLLHTLPPDIRMVSALDSRFDRYRDISVPACLMAGSKSPDYFHAGIHELEVQIPNTTTRIFDDFDHYSPEEKVSEIAGALKQFFFG